MVGSPLRTSAEDPTPGFRRSSVWDILYFPPYPRRPLLEARLNEIRLELGCNHRGLPAHSYEAIQEFRGYVVEVGV